MGLKTRIFLIIFTLFFLSYEVLFADCPKGYSVYFENPDKAFIDLKNNCFTKDELEVAINNLLGWLKESDTEKIKKGYYLLFKLKPNNDRYRELYEEANLRYKNQLKGVQQKNCSVPPLRDFIMAPYLVDRWIDNGCIDKEVLEKDILTIVNKTQKNDLEKRKKCYELLSRINPKDIDYREEYQNIIKLEEKKQANIDELNLKKKKAKLKKEKEILQAKLKKEKEMLQAKLKKEKELSDSGCEILIQNWSWSEDHGYAVAKGYIKNLTGNRLENVSVHIAWFDDEDNYITSDWSIIEYQVLMPNQSSPFKVTEDYNPMMSSAKLGITDFNAKHTYNICKIK